MLYERIQVLCKENNTTPTALCKKITGSSGNLSTWQNNNIRPAWLSAIAEEFKVTTDYLLGLTTVKTRIEDLDSEEIEFIELLKAQSPEYRKHYLEVLKLSQK